MNTPSLINQQLHTPKQSQKGFALIATVSIMALLVLIVVGMLALSTSETRKATQSEHQLIAQANARMALTIALSEAQEALGPDQRISAYATILDSDHKSEAIDGVTNPRLLGVWDSWGAWLNAKYQSDNSGNLEIADTYDKGRTKMFRRWLISSENDKSSNFTYAKSEDLEQNSITLVGENSVDSTDDYVKARLINVNSSGKLAWWVGGRNQAADIQAFKEKENLSADESELRNGDNGSIAINKVNGFDNLPESDEVIQKVIDNNQLELASVDKADVLGSFFDVTSGSASVLSDVRWGGLKKDLNLLLEKTTLPEEYVRNATLAPSVRPISQDITALGPVFPERGFTSFEQLHEFYRVYNINNNPSNTPLKWTGTAPSTDLEIGYDPNSDLRANPSGGHAEMTGYHRQPVIAKQYSVYSTLTTQNSPGNFRLDLVYSTIVVLWNPYNTPLELADNSLFIHTLPYKILNGDFKKFSNGVPDGGWRAMTNQTLRGDYATSIRSATPGQPIRFEPGQFRIFTKAGSGLDALGSQQSKLTPGYDPAGFFGQRLNIYNNSSAELTNNRGVAVRLAPRWTDGNAHWWGGDPGAFTMYTMTARSGGKLRSIGYAFDWTAVDHDYVTFSGTGDAESNNVDIATWNTSKLNDIEPFAVVGVTLKSASLLDYGDTNAGMIDYRSKNWIQGLNSLTVNNMHINYNDPNTRELQRLDNCYQLHFSDVAGINDVTRLFNVDSTRKLTALSSDELVYSIPVLELPTTPITSVAGFAGMRLVPGWFHYTQPYSGPRNPNGAYMTNTYGYTSGVPGIGTGNSFAQPSIPGDLIYKYHDISKSNPQSKTPDSGSGGGTTQIDTRVLSDFWDHALLINDGLWDSWFTSSMVDSTRNSSSNGVTLQTHVDNFFKNGDNLPYQAYTPWETGAKATKNITDTMSADGFLTVAGLIKNNSTFNVNSTSIDAWFALFSGLKNHDSVYRDASGSLNKISSLGNDIVLSRFITAPNDQEVTDPKLGISAPNNGRSWTGVRVITEDQMRRLAEECVKQVKLRGPFLNMSDFINRRLSTTETGLHGALQAAIDYDDQNPDRTSINGLYKEDGDMIPRNAPTSASYPFSMAAGGSRYTAAPGYVVQSDILRPLGNALTVRDDTFVIRAYGESLDDLGRVKSRAWCEATVQRTPEYVDSTNTPEEPATILDKDGNPSKNADLTDTNHRLGRKLKITSFRWLSPSEI